MKGKDISTSPHPLPLHIAPQRKRLSMLRLRLRESAVADMRVADMRSEMHTATKQCDLRRW